MNFDQPSPHEGKRAQWQDIIARYPKFNQLRNDYSDRKISIEQLKSGAKEFEQNFLPFDSESLKILGAPPFEGTIDRDRTDAFHKEGKIQTTEDAFAVVDDPQGKPWLMKYILDRPTTTNSERFEFLKNMQREEFAYRLAAKLGYPVPETRLTQFKGKAALAYRYIDTVKEWSRFEAGYGGGEAFVGNPMTLAIRPLMNVLWGAEEDSAFQGILDTAYNNHYYAQDVPLGYTESEMAMDTKQLIDVVAKKLIQTPKKSGNDEIKYGPMPKDSPGLRDILRTFFARVSKLTVVDAEEILEGFIGTPEEREANARELLRRAKYLLPIYERARELQLVVN